MISPNLQQSDGALDLPHRSEFRATKDVIKVPAVCPKSEMLSSSLLANTGRSWHNTLWCALKVVGIHLTRVQTLTSKLLECTTSPDSDPKCLMLKQLIDVFDQRSLGFRTEIQAFCCGNEAAGRSRWQHRCSNIWSKLLPNNKAGPLSNQSPPNAPPRFVQLTETRWPQWVVCQPAMTPRLSLFSSFHFGVLKSGPGSADFANEP